MVYSIGVIRTCIIRNNSNASNALHEEQNSIVSFHNTIHGVHIRSKAPPVKSNMRTNSMNLLYAMHSALYC